MLYGSGSAGHLIAFDRRKCKAPLNGPNATGNHCPEGFTLHKYPGPGFDDVPNSSAEASYYTWVDHHNAVGLGDERADLDRQPPGRLRRAVKDGKMILMRVPYPMGFYAKGLDAPHRRSECRLEGPRPVERERRPHALAQRARQGRASDGRAHPGAARSAGEVASAAGDDEAYVGAARTRSPDAHPD